MPSSIGGLFLAFFVGLMAVVGYPIGILAYVLSFFGII